MILEILFVGRNGESRITFSSWCKWLHRVGLKVHQLTPTSFYCSTLGAITNGASVVYLNLLQLYHTGINELNYAGAVMLLLLGVGNVFFVPLSNSMCSPCLPVRA